MKVGVCFTKQTFAGKAVLNAFFEGVKISGDKAIKIDSYSEYLKNKDCDIYVMFGWFNPNNISISEQKCMRRLIYSNAKSRNKKVIIIDTGFYPSKGYHSIGIDGLKNDAQYFTENCDSSRLLNKPKDYRKKGAHVLIFGQNRFGVSCYEIDIFKWHLKICKKVHAITNRHILFKKHPRAKFNQLNSAFPDYVNVVDKVPSLTCLQNCWVAIGYTTNALCEALFEGIPIITPSKRCICYDIANHAIENLEKPELFSMDQRLQFFNNLSYKQWTNEETAKGLPWQRLRQYI